MSTCGDLLLLTAAEMHKHSANASVFNVLAARSLLSPVGTVLLPLLW